MASLPLLPQIYYYWGLAISDCENLLKNPKMTEFLNSNHTYDLFIGSPFYFLECSVAVAHHLNLPIMNIFSNRMPIHVSHLMGHLFPYAYIAEFNLPFSHKMNFWQRSINAVFCLGYSFGLSIYYIPQMDAIVKQHFPHVPPLQEMLAQIPVTLVNTNIAVHPAQSLLPGVIPVGGLTIPQKVKLSEDLQTWMDTSDNGVVLFSLGSNIKVTSLDPAILRVLLAVFGQLRQRVLMKWEADQLDGKPGNVRVVKWIPQAAVLAHPHCQLLITHGGLHSWMEAVHYAVPLVGILPSFLDQTHNLEEMQERGHGIHFTGPWTQDSFLRVLNEVLYNHKYKENIQKASNLFWDQPLNPLQTAVYWTEYVMRHNGAGHLQSPASAMPWYRVVLLDIVTVLALCVVVSVLVMCATLRFIRRCMIDYEYVIFNRILRVCDKLKIK